MLQDYNIEINSIEQEFYGKVEVANKERLCRLQDVVKKMQSDQDLKIAFAEALDKFGFTAKNLVFVIDEEDTDCIQVRFEDDNLKDKIPYCNRGYVSVPFDFVMGQNLSSEGEAK